MNLAALLFDVARRLPEQPAVSDDRQSWNYRELARRIAGVAGGLRARGLRPGDRVLLCLENCGEFFELLFGCWAAGLCAVPANARLHPREVEYIAENSGARLLIATPGLAEALAPLAGSVDTLDAVISTRTAEYDALVTTSEPIYPETGGAANSARLFYTSGTTGRPKGAVLTHRNLLFMSQCYYADIDRLDERDTHLCAAPVSHGAGLSALARAARLLRCRAHRRAGQGRRRRRPRIGARRGRRDRHKKRLRHGRLLAEPGSQCRNPARRLAAHRRSRQPGRGRVSDIARPLEGHDHFGRQQHLSARDRGGLAPPSRCRRSLGGRPAASRLGRGGRGVCRRETRREGCGSRTRQAVPRPYRALQAAAPIPLCRGLAEEQLRQGIENRTAPAIGGTVSGGG